MEKGTEKAISAKGSAKGNIVGPSKGLTPTSHKGFESALEKKIKKSLLVEGVWATFAPYCCCHQRSEISCCIFDDILLLLPHHRSVSSVGLNE